MVKADSETGRAEYNVFTGVAGSRFRNKPGV